MRSRSADSVAEAVHSIWLVVRGERWRVVLAFVPRGPGSGEQKPLVEVGREATVVRFRDEAVVEAVSANWPSPRSVLNTKD